MDLELHKIQDKTYIPVKVNKEDIYRLNDGTKKLSSTLSKDSLRKALDGGIIFSRHGTGTEILMKDAAPIHVVESKYVIERKMAGN